MIDQVRDLPEKDVVIFIQTAEHNCRSMEMRHLGKKTKLFRVFSFDRQQYEADPTNVKKIFKQIKISTVDPTESRAKHVVAVFCHVCLQPSLLPRHMDGVKNIPGYRPRRVLFETTADVSHPQVASFLRLMGCTDIGVLEPAAQTLLANNLGEVQPKNISGVSDRKQMPYLADLFSEKVCGSGNCSVVGKSAWQPEAFLSIRSC